MNDLSFWDIYLPFLAALFTSTVILEAISFAIRYRQAKEQMKRFKEIEAKIASGEMPPPGPFDLMAPPGGFGFDYPPASPAAPTVSGEHGQYL